MDHATDYTTEYATDHAIDFALVRNTIKGREVENA